MPFTIRTTFAFAGLEQGWTESFYWVQQTDNLQTAEDTVQPIAQARAKLLAKDYTLTVGRNAIVLGNGGEKVLRVSDLFEPRYKGVQSWDSAQPNVALMCVWQTGDNKLQKKQYMRGVPAGIADMGKVADSNFGAFLSNFNSWRSKLISLQAGWLATTVTQTAIVNSYTLGATNGIVTFALGGAGLTWPVPIGAQTRVYVQLPGRSPLDGPLLVVPTSDTSCFTAKPIGVGPFQTGLIGVMKIRSPTLVTLAQVGSQGASGQIHPQRMVTHQTGRPSYASRGRSAVRPRW